MADTTTQDNLVFGLDIGTRNVVGTVGYLERDRFKVLAMAVKEHDTRAMLDGQIHDIYKVGETIRTVKYQLEKMLNRQLTEVCIAAAGRVLKTVNVHADYEFEEETRITQEHIYSLDLIGVEKAHGEINDGSSDVQFYCVGSTPIRYMLNDYVINNLEGHKGIKMGVDLIATFLPEEVVDGLYQAVAYADLSVANLTLEPIAAINVAIPQQYRLLNIALVDVGAGTSDICLTKDGSIIAYGMIPFAGDEITEVIAKNYLVDFNTAEKIKVGANKKKGTVTYKDIMGLTNKIDVSDVKKVVEPVIDKMSKEAADKIMELNGGKPVSAVFIVGGGGKLPSYAEKLADYLSLPHERVALRGEEVLQSVDFMIEDYKKDSLFVTPVGICMNYYSQKSNFIFVQVNGQRVKLYDNNKLTVVDAIMQSSYPNEFLFPRRGKEIEFTVNGKTRMVRGHAGEAAIIKVNGRETNMNSLIEQNDRIEITESTIGEDASITIGQLEEFKGTVSFQVNGSNVVCPRFAYVNGKLESEYYQISNGDNVSMENFYTVSQLFTFLDIDYSQMQVYVNNEPATDDTKVYENFNVTFAKAENPSDEEISGNPENADETGYDYIEAEDKTEDKTEDKSKTKEVQQDSAVAEAPKEPKDIFIMINKTPVKLSGKAEYVVVDLFDFYPFDLSKPQGNVVLKQNGKNAEYMAALNDGDIIELYWE